MLRFCDSSVAAPNSSAEALSNPDVLGGELRITSSVFPPALLGVGAAAPHPRDLEELPRLDTRFGQSLA